MSVTIDTTTIPIEMRSLPQWVVWKREKTESGKWTKIPYRADGKGRASSTDPATWSTYEAALAVASRYSGIGFVTTKECGIILLDMDHCIADGEVAPWAAEILAVVKTAVEVSPSRTGMHGYFYGKLPDRGRKCGDAEIYDSGRFFCVTGNMDPAYNRPFRRLSDEETARVYALVCARAPSSAPATTAPTASATAPVNGSRHNLLVSIAGSVARGGGSVEAIESAAMAVNQTFTEPKPTGEVKKIAAWAAVLRPGTQAPTETIDPATLEQHIFRPSWDNEPPELPALISFATVPVLNPGDIAGAVALAGTGKTQVVGAIVAAALNPMCDALGFTVAAKSLLLVDTEQGHYHDWKDWSKAMRRGEVGKGFPPPASIQWECISTMQTLAERQAYLWSIFSRPIVPQILILDGIADFLGDVNSTEETAALVYRLIALAKTHNVGVVVTLHMNPQGGSEKGRGNLGSEIWRKAQAMFAIKRDLTDKNVREVTTAFSLGKVRGAPDQLTAWFRWNDEAGMFLSCPKPTTATSTGRKATENDKLLACMETRVWDFTELRNRFAVELGKSPKTGERRIEALVELGLVTKMADGRYQAVTADVSDLPERWDQK